MGGLFVGTVGNVRQLLNNKAVSMFQKIGSGKQLEAAVVPFSDTEQMAQNAKNHQKKKGFFGIHEMWIHLITAVVLFKIVIGLGCLWYFLYNLEKGESKTFIDCLYFSIITTTTIGYGDEAPTNSGGRILGAIYLLISLPAFAHLSYVLFDIPLQRRKKWAEDQVLAQYGG